MTDEEKYLFDLQGYLHVPQVLEDNVVSQSNREIDDLLSMQVDQLPGHAEKHENCSADSVNGTDVEITNVAECGPLFETLIDHSKVMPYIREMINHHSLRMTHAYAIIRSKGDATPLHRGRFPVAGQCRYRFEGGRFYCQMIKVVYLLTDLREGDGGFSVIPGSHKSNLPCVYFDKQTNRRDHPDDVPVLIELTGRGGDAFMFTEDLTHGARTNRNGKQRRNLYYSYQPSYMPDWMSSPSDELMARLAPARRALIGAPHY
jgi:ectoine hydroxylase-related dioxygenase (phytanoyl-CoA dioxygenase family)